MNTALVVMYGLEEIKSKLHFSKKTPCVSYVDIEVCGQRYNNFFSKYSKKMDTDNEYDFEEKIVYLNCEIFSNKKLLIKFLNILEKLSKGFNVNLPQQIRVSSSVAIISSNFSLVGFHDDKNVFHFAFVKEIIPNFSNHESNEQSGLFNTIKKMNKNDSSYLQQVEHLCDCDINSEIICRFPSDNQISENHYLEAFISIIASFKKIGPSVYGIYEKDYVSWVIQKGKCDLSQSILYLHSDESAVNLAKSCISLLLKTSEVRLILFDIKLQNLIDLGSDVETSKRILAIDFDPKFTLFGPKSFTALSFVVNTTLLLSSTKCWYGHRNKYVDIFISEHKNLLKYYIEMWNEKSVLNDLYIVLKEKFFKKNEEYIGKFKEYNDDIFNPEIWEIAKKFKKMFVNMANEFIFTTKDDIPLFNCAHFCQIIEWLGVTRTAGCDNEKLMNMAMKNLPENWSLNLDGKEFQILYQNCSLEVETFERPPDFRNLKEQLNWYMQLMMKKHNGARGKEKENIGKKMLDILLSDKNKWFIHENENIELKNLLIKKILDLKNREKTNENWCNKHLNVLLPS